MTTIRCPAGTYGLAAAPWSPTEVYAVAAAWGEASSPVLTWSGSKWVPTQYQVADFRHDPRAALRQILADEASAGGGESCVDDAVRQAVDIE